MKQSACQEFPLLLLTELAQIKRWRKTAILAEDPEGVHQLRVSLRRMRSAFDIFKPVLQPDYRQRWQKELKTLARFLDEARDLDVFLLTHFNENKTDASVLESHLRKQKKRSDKKLCRLLQSKQFNKPRRQLKKQLKNKHWSRKHGRHCSMLTTTLAARQLQQHYEQVQKQLSALDINNEAALHRSRIRIKQLRYGCELLAPVLKHKTNASFITAMKALQDDLGLIHDAYVQQLMQHDLPPPTQDEFRTIAHKSQANSDQLKATLAGKLKCFSALPLPWHSLKQD
ncbi:CHAD domain-containing protein [uncultured Methylophaga sp.]|jgi:CHAD domain-containing protein|uniref:CHAD domain-containing protein n=1 Tax=uncultured Methylophaga sp. TaxID=285271 RepID=UPI00260ED559|nr:CHAD domain-containing protein [uncultured Methylophaga sp.]